MILDGKDYLIGLGVRAPMVPDGEKPWLPFALALGSNGTWARGDSVAEVLGKVSPKSMARIDYIKLWVGFVEAFDLECVHAVNGNVVIPRESVYHVIVFKKGKAVQL